MDEMECRNCFDRTIKCLECAAPETCGAPYGVVASAVFMLVMALLYIWFGS